MTGTDDLLVNQTAALTALANHADLHHKANDEIHGSLEMSQKSRQKFVVSVMKNLAAFATGERMKSTKEAVRKP